MEIDGPPEPCPLTDPEPLRQVLVALQGSNATYLARLTPVQPPMVEKKGLLGRSRPVPAPWQVDLVHWADEDGSGQFEATLTAPPGSSFHQRPTLPPGVTVNEGRGDRVTVSIDPSASPAVAAAVLAGLVPAVYGDVDRASWQAQLVDNDFSGGD